MNELKKNFMYNVIYQILILIIPFITTPYVSRILHPEGVGIYSYTYSIVYYFMLVAMLGLNKYGNRKIAQVKDNKEKLSKTFKEIYIMQLLISIIMVIIYLIYVFLFEKKYTDIALLQSLYVVSCMFDINWFFFGLEQFKFTVTRNTIIKILNLFLIFIFVKNENDVWIYTLILSGCTLLSQLLLWPFVRKFVDNVPITFSGIKKHFKPNLILFLPVIAVAVYRMMDKTMIGIFSDMKEVGIYESAEKVINMPIAIITALGTVMLPRTSNMYANGLKEEGKTLIEKSLKFTMFLSFAMMFRNYCNK